MPGKKDLAIATGVVQGILGHFSPLGAVLTAFDLLKGFGIIKTGTFINQAQATQMADWGIGPALLVDMLSDAQEEGIPPRHGVAMIQKALGDAVRQAPREIRKRVQAKLAANRRRNRRGPMGQHFGRFSCLWHARHGGVDLDALKRSIALRRRLWGARGRVLDITKTPVCCGAKFRDMQRYCPELLTA